MTGGITIHLHSLRAVRCLNKGFLPDIIPALKQLERRIL